MRISCRENNRTPKRSIWSTRPKMSGPPSQSVGLISRPRSARARAGSCSSSIEPTPTIQFPSSKPLLPFHSTAWTERTMNT